MITRDNKPPFLTDLEIETLYLIARRTKMDCWFAIWETEESGSFVVDIENRADLPLYVGIAQLISGMVEPIEDPFYRLAWYHIKTFYALLDELHLRKEYNEAIGVK